MRISVIYLGVVLMALQLFSCNAGERNIKVEWRPGINAPKYYPCKIASGSFTDGEKKCYIATGGNRNGGWGLGGLEMCTGTFVPNELSITWFSYAEDKFYSGTFSLPTDTIYDLFVQGCISAQGLKTKYDYMVVNVYPEGGVALWMDSSGGRCVEIDHFQAQEIEYNWRSMYPHTMRITKEEYIRSLIHEDIEGAAEYIAQHGLSPEPFKTVYRQRYNYTIAIDNISHSNTEVVQVEFYNGEKDMISGEELENNFFKTKAVPKYIFLKWFENRIVYFGEMSFNEAEILKAFADMSTAHPNEPFVLLLKPDYSRRKLSVSLRSQADDNGDISEIEISKTGRTGKSLDQDFANKK